MFLKAVSSARDKLPYVLLPLIAIAIAVSSALIILAPHTVYRLWQNGVMAWPWGGNKAARMVSNWLEDRL